MGWFKRKPKEEPVVIKPAISSRVEVELHKNASVEAAKKADAANKHINDLLVENGFTLKIYLAAGGHQPTNKRSGNKK